MSVYLPGRIRESVKEMWPAECPWWLDRGAGDAKLSKNSWSGGGLGGI